MSGLRQVHSDKLRACSDCAGNGQVTCHICNGRGRLPLTRTGYDAEGRCHSDTDYEPCTTCSGTGKVRCSYCGGTGNRPIYGGSRAAERDSSAQRLPQRYELIAQAERAKTKLVEWMTRNGVDLPVDEDLGLLEAIRIATQYGPVYSRYIQDRLDRALELLGGPAATAHGAPYATLALLITVYLDTCRDLNGRP